MLISKNKKIKEVKKSKEKAEKEGSALALLLNEDFEDAVLALNRLSVEPFLFEAIRKGLINLAALRISQKRSPFELALLKNWNSWGMTGFIAKKVALDDVIYIIVDKFASINNPDANLPDNFDEEFFQKFFIEILVLHRDFYVSGLSGEPKKQREHLKALFEEKLKDYEVFLTEDFFFIARAELVQFAYLVFNEEN